MKRLVLAVCVVMAGLGGVGVTSHGIALAAPGGNSDAAHACQQSGYLTLHGSDGTTFKNEGQCVSYAAKGGKIVGVSACTVTATTGCLTFNGVTLPSFDLSGNSITVTGSTSFVDTCVGECVESSFPNNLATGGGTYVLTNDLTHAVISSGIYRIANGAGSQEGLFAQDYSDTNHNTSTCANGTYIRLVELNATLIPSTGGTQTSSFAALTGSVSGQTGEGAVLTPFDTFDGPVPSNAITC